MRRPAVLLASLLAACAQHNERPPAEPPFPPKVGVFELVEPPYRGRDSITAGYQSLTPTGAVIATVQRRPVAVSHSLVPELDRGHGDADAIADAAIARSMQQVRRFYADAAAQPVRHFLVFRGGAMRPARATAMDYADGDAKPMRMQIDVVCCTASGEVVEYRFRHPAAVTVDAEISEFVRVFPWTEEEAPH
jgi:hypothetical protein